MDMRIALDPECNQVLLDIYELLMTWNTDEKAVLHKICERLVISRSYHMAWGALFEADHALHIVAAAGIDVSRIIGEKIEPTKDDLGTENHANPIATCINFLSPASLDAGLMALHHTTFLELPKQVQHMPAMLYPLALQGKAIGLICIVSENTRPLSQHDHLMLLIASRHTGFALGMLRAFAAKDTALADLQLAAAVFDNSLEGIFITDDQGSILVANSAVSRITEYSNEELVGQNPRLFQSGRHDRIFYSALWKSVTHTGQWQGEIWNRRKNGEVYPQWLSISAIRDQHGLTQHYIGIFIDISAQKEAELRLDYLAHHDKLTSLPNRDLFNDRLTVAIAHSKRTGKPLAVLFIDLDHFKYVNDTFGHITGDELLQAAARRISGCLREEDTLSRMGGDEFTVLLQHFNNREEIGLVASKIVHAMKSPFMIGQHELYVTASIGISIHPDDGDNPETLLKNSDAAMYRAKNDGRNCIQYFKLSMEGDSMQRIEIDRDLHRALLQEEFRVFYQPQVDLAQNKVVGVEALIRWQPEQGRLILPGQFIPMAEETGLIVEIGEWVLREACAQMKEWLDDGMPPLRIAVNLSAQQFRKVDFSKIVAGILSDTGLPPQMLELELTESIAMHHAEDTVSTLNRLKALGVQISIDDFGTGYSSLSYLKRFPVDRLKVDRSFVEGIADDPSNAAITLAIIAMAHSLGISVIAEGVETEEQLDFLRMHHCNEVQGYYLGHPMPADEIESLIQG